MTDVTEAGEFIVGGVIPDVKNFSTRTPSAWREKASNMIDMMTLSGTTVGLKDPITNKEYGNYRQVLLAVAKKKGIAIKVMKRKIDSETVGAWIAPK